MTNPLPVVVDAAADVRWRDWQARGAESDRRSAAHARKVMFLIGGALVAWFVFRLA